MIQVNKSFLVEISDDIARLRDSDFHVCKHDKMLKMEDEGIEVPDDMDTTCTCHEFDAVRDKINDVIEMNEKDYMQPCELYDTEQRLESLGRIDDLDRRK